MSTKGTKLTTVTKAKIGLANTKINRQALIQVGQEYIEELQHSPKLLPTITGYALRAGINERTIYDLANTITEVNQILDTIRTMQADYCLTRGITNQANPIFSMFLLKSKHNFLDTPQQLNQTNNFNISPDVLADALKLMNGKSSK